MYVYKIVYDRIWMDRNFSGVWIFMGMNLLFEYFRLFEKAQHDRQIMSGSLQRVRKCDFAERVKLAELEDTFEREFSRVLM